MPPEERARNNSAQRKAGGDLKREDDDGGHLIGARFGGSPYDENLSPQNRGLNRGMYKKLENEWEKELRKGNKVFVYITVSASCEGNREDSVYGSYVIEKPDGTKIFEAFGFENESVKTQEAWEQESDLIYQNNPDYW